jgi:CHAT domain-containing protein
MSHPRIRLPTKSSSPFFIGSIDDIDKEITYLQDTLFSLSRPSHRHAPLLDTLSKALFARYILSHDDRDLETSILHSTHAILLPFPLPRNIISAFYFLTQAVSCRMLKSKLPSDVTCNLKYLYYLRNPLFGRLGIPHKIITFLVPTLALQMKLEPGTAMQCLEEMAILCHERLSSGFLGPELNRIVESFAEAVITRIGDFIDQPSQQIIKCLCEANARFPDSYHVSIALSMSFLLRFVLTQSNEDYERAMAPLDRIITSHSPAESPKQDLTEALAAAANLAYGRFILFGTPEYLEEAISRTRVRLISTSLEDSKRGDVTQFLEELERRRLDDFGITHAIPEVHPSNPETICPPPFSDLTASLTKMNATESPSMTNEDYFQHLDALSSMNHITDRRDIDEAIKYCRLLLASLEQSPIHPTTMRDSIVIQSGYFLYHAFRITNNPEYLDESIDVHQGIRKTSHSQWTRLFVVHQLISSMFSRFWLSMDSIDLDELMELFPVAATDTYTTVSRRFEVACLWAPLARACGHSSTSAAYNSAISLIQDALTFAPTLEIQHSHLVTMRNHIETLPLDHASYLAHLGQLKEAIETLERGRGLLWSEMRGLRISIDHLRRVDPLLARDFAALNGDLEALTTSVSPVVWLKGGGVNYSEEMDPFGYVVVKQRKLLDERNHLITQIRLLPGLENFLMGPLFDALRSAAAHGPVIIVNHSKWRSDIIILLYNSPPSLIPTPDNFYARAEDLKDQLSTARQEGLDSKEYEDALTSVLETLYDLVGRPVVQRLHELNVPEQSRIWWCPTSVFCSLPLHAMGPIRSDGHHKLYFLDLYIPSYTPTLSALIESRKHGLHSFEKPSILLVAQPDEFMPKAWDEIYLIRHLNTTVTTLTSKRAMPSGVLRHLQDHRFAHFSCHGILEMGKPFDASFKLYQGQRLTLLDIIRSRLPSAEFAFLSACHTAELTEESIVNEGLHLSAAVQYSGFRSVVGTMWAMADIDGQVLVKHFYSSVFSDKWKSVPYYERTAEALRDAVQVLRRRKKVTTERWVNFVHYGA